MGKYEKALSKIVSLLQTIHGGKVPIKIVKYDVIKKSSEEYLIKGEYRLIISAKTKSFTALLNKEGDVKYLERIEKTTWRHPIFEKESFSAA